MAYRISPKELELEEDEYYVIDVREADELEEGKISGSTNNPLGQLIRRARRGELDDLKNKKIVTYCNSGYRGSIAVEDLRKQDFDAATIEGGYSAFKAYATKRTSKQEA